MNVGARVRFKAHGETGLICTVVTRDGDDVTLQDPRGRLLRRTPIELLEFAGATQTHCGCGFAVGCCEYLDTITRDCSAVAERLSPGGVASPSGADDPGSTPGRPTSRAWREVDELAMPPDPDDTVRINNGVRP